MLAAGDLLLAHCWEDRAIKLSRKACYHGRALGAYSHLPHPQNKGDLVGQGGLDGPSSCNYTSHLLCVWMVQSQAIISVVMPCGSTHSLGGCL